MIPLENNRDTPVEMELLSDPLKNRNAGDPDMFKEESRVRY